METRPYLLHALSPVHAGTGQAVDVIDLPIARMRSTGIPVVPGSSIKGVLRDAIVSDQTSDRETTLAVFGPETSEAGDHAGALLFGDARLVALPVRSFQGTFAWVTSPLLLELARRDCQGLPELPKGIPSLKSHGCVVAAIQGDSSNLNTYTAGNQATIYLEDLDLPVGVDKAVVDWADFFAPHVAPRANPGLFTRRFVVLDDETMSFLWERSTQIDTRIRLDPQTRTVAKGALWVEESLPPETVLIGILAADRTRRKGVSLVPREVLNLALPSEVILQFGGKATVGRGRCRMIPVLTQS